MEDWSQLELLSEGVWPFSGMEGEEASELGGFSLAHGHLKGKRREEKKVKLLFLFEATVSCKREKGVFFFGEF